MINVQYPQPVSDAEVGPGAVVEVLPVLTGQRGGGNLAAGENHSGQVPGRRQGPRHVPDAYQTTRGNLLSLFMALAFAREVVH